MLVNLHLSMDQRLVQAARWGRLQMPLDVRSAQSALQGGKVLKIGRRVRHALLHGWPPKGVQVARIVKLGLPQVTIIRHVTRVPKERTQAARIHTAMYAHPGLCRSWQVRVATRAPWESTQKIKRNRASSVQKDLFATMKPLTRAPNAGVVKAQPPTGCRAKNAALEPTEMCATAVAIAPRDSSATMVLLSAQLAPPATPCRPKAP